MVAIDRKPFNRTKTIPRKISSEVRKYGRQNLKAGTHPQQWRQTSPTPAQVLQGPGATLGPMHELGDDVMIYCGLSYQGEQFLVSKIARELNVMNFTRLFRNEVYEKLRVYVNKWIAIKVPMDTEDLRNSMRNAMTPSGGSLTNKYPFEILMNTKGIPYASVMNEAPEAWLRHPASYHRNIGRFGAPLNDPRAVKGWYNWIVLMGRQYAEKLFKAFVKSTIQPLIKPFGPLIGVSGIGVYHLARSIFTVRFL